MIKRIKDLHIKIFGDGADKKSILKLAKEPYIKGFTTNPTLMRAAGVVDYEKFARDILRHIPKLPVSFEVFSDSLEEMEKQAKRISSWGPNVYVKIPITNTKSVSTFRVIQRLSNDKVKINVTAILSLKQVRHIVPAFAPKTPGIVSVFAGRVANTGRDPVPLMTEAKRIISKSRRPLELLWASPRELLNIFQADKMGCNIITVTPDILKNLSKVGYDLEAFSLDTVKMFYEDGLKAGYRLHE